MGPGFWRPEAGGVAHVGAVVCMGDGGQGRLLCADWRSLSLFNDDDDDDDVRKRECFGKRNGRGNGFRSYVARVPCSFLPGVVLSLTAFLVTS